MADHGTSVNAIFFLQPHTSISLTVYSLPPSPQGQLGAYQLHLDVIRVYYNYYIHGYNFKNSPPPPPPPPPKLFVSLEYKYNRLLCCTRINSIEVSYASLRLSMSTTKLTAKNFIQEQRHSPRVKSFRALSSTHWCSCSRHTRRASRNRCEGLEETLLDGVSHESFFLGLFVLFATGYLH